MNEISKTAELFAYKIAKETQYVYHIKSKDFKGKYIYPLSELKDAHPDIYKKQIAKYKGREDHPEIKIKPLDCKWKDCVNLSTLNPIKIFQLEELLGIPGYKKGKDVEVFKIKISDLDSKKFCLYDDEKSPKSEAAYSKRTETSYKETQFIPTKTAKYFVTSKEKKEYPLLFAYVKHVLYNGIIDISKAEIIKFTANETITKF